jgi:hypothetical protein
MTNEEIVQAELLANNITLCAGCDNGDNHNRGWAYADERTIHYAKKCATRRTLYGFLHEVGHIVMGHGSKCGLRRFEKEAQAEEYARASLRMLGITVPRSKVASGNAYIARRKRTGDRIIRARRAP